MNLPISSNCQEGTPALDFSIIVPQTYSSGLDRKERRSRRVEPQANKQAPQGRMRSGPTSPILPFNKIESYALLLFSVLF
jgi:hypothetical protein